MLMRTRRPVTSLPTGTAPRAPVAPPVCAPAAVCQPAISAPPVLRGPSALAVNGAVTRSVAGLPAGFDALSLSKDAASGLAGTYVPRPAIARFVGYGNIAKVTATPDGFRVDVDMYSPKGTDEIALFLQLPVLDSKLGSLTFFNLDLLTYDGTGGFTKHIPRTPMNDPAGRACFGGSISFQLSLEQINLFIKNSGLNLVVKPGDQLSISGLVSGDGHRIMNATSNTFVVPRPTLSPAHSVKPAQVAGAQRTAVRAQDLPLDISIKLSKELLGDVMDVAGYGWITAGDVIEGEITTRLESEYKGAVTASQLDSMITNSYALAALSERAELGDAAAKKKLTRLLGADLVLLPVKRHWLASDGEPVGDRDPNNLGQDKNGQPLTIPKDAKGWPMIDPMKDIYTDDKKLTFCGNSGAARTRGNKQKMGHAEFKLDGGVLDEATGIRQRVEVGLSLKPGVDDAKLTALLRHMEENFALCDVARSPLGHILTEAKKAGMLDALIGDRTPWAEVSQIRHKFELKNSKTGTSAELSLDLVHAKTLRAEHQVNGQPQEQVYCVVETELDHLQINSINVTQMLDSKAKTALTSTAHQEAWLKARTASGGADLSIMNKLELHSIDHVKDGSFRQTESYQEYQGMQANLLVAICGTFKPGPARQKSAHFAELLGLVPAEQTVTTKS